MKKTCEGCKALEMIQYDKRCLLGFKFDEKTFKPLEECPKPLTIKKFVELNKYKHEKRESD